jgi:hypothetical protein
MSSVSNAANNASHAVHDPDTGSHIQQSVLFRSLSIQGSRLPDLRLRFIVDLSEPKPKLLVARRVADEAAQSACRSRS